jgi:hypothetical protein
MAEFMGKAGFQWFVGVVEDRKDPQTLGRLRVRCLGYHTEGLDKLPTKDLPWAHVMNPITSATVSGLGQSPLGAVEGTWVVGFFQDGGDAQQPIIIGTLPGVPSELPDTGSKKGFQDAVNGAYPKYKNETDVNRLSVNDEALPHSTLTMRKADRTLSVGTAQIDGIFNGVATIERDLDEGGTASGSPQGGSVITGGEWSEPETPYAAEYPHNHVYESEAGHIREMDDTPTKERIHERHASGTGYEIGPDGTKVTRVKKDNYTITTNDDYTHIQGTQRHTTDEGVRIRVNADGAEGNNYNIEVGAGSNVNVEVNKGNINLTTLSPDVGDININASRDLNMQVGRNVNMQVLNKVDIDVKGLWRENVDNGKTESTTTHIMNATLQDINGSSEVDIDGGTINLN